jgi:hypothetical protein
MLIFLAPSAFVLFSVSLCGLLARLLELYARVKKGE